MNLHGRTLARTLSTKAIIMKEFLTALAKKADADYCEIRLEDSMQTSLAYLGEDLENVQESHMYGGNVRVVVDGCWGFVTFNNVDEIERRMREAVTNARAGTGATGGGHGQAERAHRPAQSFAG